jgi:hypothetical protein
MTPGDVEQFRFLSNQIIVPRLAMFGFQPDGEMCEESEHGPHERSLVFRTLRSGEEPQYLLIQLVTLICNNGKNVEWVQMLLGEGLHTGEERRFNSTSIWEITQARGSGFTTTPYLIGSEGRPEPDLTPALTYAAQELFLHAADFLAGDLSNFRSVRAAQNAVAPTYPAIMCDSDGRLLNENERRCFIESLEKLRSKYA